MNTSGGHQFRWNWLHLSGQPLTSWFFLSDIVWHHGSMFTVKFILLSRWCSKYFIHLGQLARAKQNALLDEMFPITQWIITNLFIWTYSWHYKPFSEFIANILKKKVTLLKETKKKRKNKQFNFFQTNGDMFLYNLAKQSTRDCISFLSSEQWQSIAGSLEILPWVFKISLPALILIDQQLRTPN